MPYVCLPPQYAVDTKIADNTILQLQREEIADDLQARPYMDGRFKGLAVTRGDGSEILVTASRTFPQAFVGDVVMVRGARSQDLIRSLGPETRKTWLRTSPHAPSAGYTGEGETRAKNVLGDWQNQFNIRLENSARGQPGLRTPQLGALYAILAHWLSVPTTLATIVMPTGTGKTETMLALLVKERLPRLLVIVPTNALRDQIAGKFVTLGVLRRFGIISEDAPYPIVGKVEHQFRTPEQASKFFCNCNVVIATIHALNACAEGVRRVIAESCSHLVIDEAHHVSANTWQDFRRRFDGKPIVQFTATPFRNDGQHIGGKIIFSYPLGKAQAEKYFTRINFKPVFAYTGGDHAIAEAAVKQLETDRDAGLQHLVMARTKTIERADEVHAIYRRIADKHNPLLVHSKMSAGERADAIRKLREGEAKVVVCVDMLGEGFDLPELKIAALHDIHKSLAITLQFTGRFTRVKGDGVGEATMIANRADTDVQQRLRALYSEDADWNEVIRDLSHEATGNEEARSEFLASFGTMAKEIPIQNVEPKMSTVVYRTHCSEWDPEGIRSIFPPDRLYTSTLSVSEQHRVVWFVTQTREAVPWGEVRELANVVYDLYVLHWDEEAKLLFVNSSNNTTVHEELATAVAGSEAELIRGEQVYRAMHGIARMTPTNLGLLDTRSRARRFTMFTGSDTTEGLHPSQTQTKAKTNMFGIGYEGGARASVGCSTKGRIWSYLIAHDIGEWILWCHHIGKKLLDDDIRTEDIIKGFVKAEPVTKRPPLVPLAIEWPVELLAQQEGAATIRIGDAHRPFFDVGLELLGHDRDRPIGFRVVCGKATAEYELRFTDKGTHYQPRGAEAFVTLGTRDKLLSEWLRQYPPKIYFEKDTTIEQDHLLRIDRELPPFPDECIETRDWSATDITKESQGQEKNRASVQRKIIDELLATEEAWDVIFDDDAAHEIADIVAIRMTGDRLIIHLYHCKYSHGPQPGQRVEDLYEVCGQAQKSVFWRDRAGLETLLPRLVFRESDRLNKGMVSRFERGTLRTLDEIGARQHLLNIEFKIWIVQPGVSKEQITQDMLALLASTSLYLRETADIELGVVASI